jgi:DNA transformation protein and related proteins
MLANMAVSSDYLQYVLEQLAGLAQVTSRRMFGGMGLYCDGVFFGLIDDDTLFFKVDDSNRGDYVARGMAAFRPFKDRPDQSMAYFEVPADALEDRDELALWARKSVAAALASPGRSARKPARKPGGKPAATSATPRSKARRKARPARKP